MANTNLIYTYIQDSGYKLQYVASVLHISSNTLRHKLLGRDPVQAGRWPSGFPPCWA